MYACTITDMCMALITSIIIIISWHDHTISIMEGSKFGGTCKKWNLLATCMVSYCCCGKPAFSYAFNHFNSKLIIHETLLYTYVYIATCDTCTEYHL